MKVKSEGEGEGDSFVYGYADAVLIAYAEKSLRICTTLVEHQPTQNLSAIAMR